MILLTFWEVDVTLKWVFNKLKEVDGMIFHTNFQQTFYTLHSGLFVLSLLVLYLRLILV